MQNTHHQMEIDELINYVYCKNPAKCHSWSYKSLLMSKFNYDVQQADENMKCRDVSTYQRKSKFPNNSQTNSKIKPVLAIVCTVGPGFTGLRWWRATKTLDQWAKQLCTITQKKKKLPTQVISKKPLDGALVLTAPTPLLLPQPPPLPPPSTAQMEKRCFQRRFLCLSFSPTPL